MNFTNSNLKQWPVIYHGGEILTMENDSPSYSECLVVSNQSDGGKILYSGRIKDLDTEIKSNGRWFDLKGACLTPGFIDPHLHPSMAAVLLTTDFITPFDWNLPDRPKIKGIRSEKEYLKGNESFIGNFMKSDAEKESRTIKWQHLLL